MNESEPDPEAQPSRLWPFVKGALLPPPVFMALGGGALMMLNATGDAPLFLFFLGFVGVVVGFGRLVSRRWASARPFAVGVLVSLLVWGALLGVFGLLVVAAAGAGSKG